MYFLERLITDQVNLCLNSQISQRLDLKALTSMKNSFRQMALISRSIRWVVSMLMLKLENVQLLMVSSHVTQMAKKCDTLLTSPPKKKRLHGRSNRHSSKMCAALTSFAPMVNPTSVMSMASALSSRLRDTTWTVRIRFAASSVTSLKGHTMT